MSNYKSIGFDKSDGVASITLQRGELNVLNIAMMEEINSALESLNNGSDLKAVVIRASGKAFSAGVDVSEHTTELVNKMIGTFHRMFRLLDKMECPTIALVQGAALGGGCELACFCDMVVAREHAKFGQPEIKVGVFPPVAAAGFPQYGFLKKMYELLLIGETITAEEAQTFGLVNTVFPKDGFEESCREWLGKLTSNSGAILRLTKKAIRIGQGRPFDDALTSVEQIYLTDMMATKDAHEGLSAFLEKRKPKWVDR